MQARAEGSQRWRPQRVLWHTVRSPAPAFERRLARRKAGMAELVDALDSKSSGATRVGSTPTLGTTFETRRRGRTPGCDSLRGRRVHAIAQKNAKAGFSSGVSLVFSGHARRRSSSPIGLRSRHLVRGASATPARQVQRGGDGAPARPAPLVQLARHERAGASARRDVGGISGAEAALTR
jgi:hypothetical protein